MKRAIAVSAAAVGILVLALLPAPDPPERRGHRTRTFRAPEEERIEDLALRLGTDAPPGSPWTIEVEGRHVRLDDPLDGDSREAAIRHLDDPVPRVRWLAARLLRHTPAARDVLAEHLDDPDPDVQEEIADAIAEDPRFHPRLLELGLRSDRVRFRIEDALRDAPVDPRWFERTLAESRDEAVRLWCFEILAHHRPEGFDPVPFLLADPNPKIREQAARWSGDPRALADPEWNVRLACVEASDDPAVLEAARFDPDERVRRAATEKSRP